MLPDTHSEKKLSAGASARSFPNNELIQKLETKNGQTLLYKDQYLYSRFDAKKNPQRIIDSLEIKDESLFFIFSPLLGYGLEELFQKIPENCFVLAIETDPVLYQFSISQIDTAFFNKPNFLYLLIEENNFGIQELIQKIDRITTIEKTFSFRKLITLELNKSFISDSFKQSCVFYIDNYINQFCRNRITLIKMGRLYAKNIFQNLSSFIKNKKIEEKSVFKPILVLGAGISLEKNIDIIKKINDDIFIIAVDTALSYLLKQNIKVDLCITVEPQLINQKAFIGAKNTKIPILADLCSFPANTKILGGEQYFFLSEYASLEYLEKIKSVTYVYLYKPLGSVGLVAIETALRLRLDDGPIFFTGFDFAYPLGKTHVKESPSHIEKMLYSNRLNPLGNITQLEKKNKNDFYTNPALENYAMLFDERFGKSEDFYNLSETSILNCKRCSYTRMCKIVDEYNKSMSIFDTSFIIKELDYYYEKRIPVIKNFLKEEYQDLEELKKNIETISNSDFENKVYEEKLVSWLKNKDYLYIHFPEAYKKIKLTNSFINRLKIEIVYFQKSIKKALKNTESIFVNE